MTNPFQNALLTEAAIAGAGDGTLFLSGDGTMKKPSGGGGSLPLTPFFGNILNTGWTRPSLSTFSTWLNQLGSTATDDIGGPLILDSALTGATDATAQLTALLKPIGAPPWTITTASVALGNIGNEFYVPYYPIILNNSSSNKAVAFGWGLGGGLSYAGVWVAHFDNTAPGNAPTYQPDPSSNVLGFPFMGYFQWFRIIHDGVNLTFQISQEGTKFYTVFTEAANVLVSSFDTVGFGADIGATVGALTLHVPGSSITGLFISEGIWQWID